MSNKKTTIQFIKEANKIHNNKYDYSLVEYKNNSTKVKIICPIHGVFEQLPTSHLYYKCPKCSHNKHKITDEFIVQSNLKFNNKFNYSNFIYKNSNTKGIIICPIHGVFEQTPNNHLQSKYGCPKCGRKITDNNHKLSNKEFIERSNKIHNNEYEYVERYKSYHKKINIRCKKHGIFSMSPSKHLNFQGCPMCKNKIKKEDMELYIFFDKKNKLYKIGISKNHKKRLRQLPKIINKNIDVIYIRKKSGHLENLIHELYKEYKLNHPIKHGGYTEWFNFKKYNINEIILNINKID
jgi:hypothetical protein